MLNVVNDGCVTKKFFQNGLKQYFFYHFILLQNIRFACCTRRRFLKKNCIKELCKKFLIKLCGIHIHAEKYCLCSYKNSTNQAFTCIGSKIIYFRERALSMQEGWRGGEFSKCFKKYFVAQETINLNILSPSNFFRKYFTAAPINFSSLFKTYLQQYFRVVLTVIFKFQITKEVNIHNNIQKIIFK